MAIIRPIKIDLSEYSEFWNDSYIIVGAVPFTEKNKFEIEASKFQLLVKRIQRDFAPISKKIDELVEKYEPIPDELLEKEKETEQKIIKASEDIIEMSKKLIEAQFISGNLYDIKQEKIVEMTKDDIAGFDANIISDIAQHILGNISKKKNES